LTNNLLEPITQLFRPQAPLAACEFTPRHVIAAGVNASRKRIASKAAAELPPHALAGSLAEKNVVDPQAVLGQLNEAAGQAGFKKGHEIGIVIPDDAARISFITAESLPASTEERAAFIRWKLKKTVPFEVDTAQIAFTIMGTRLTGENKGTDLLVALSPRTVIEEYERMIDSLGFESGYVIPSSLAALKMLTVPNGDMLFLKIAPGCIATTVFQNGRPEFYRKVAEMPLYDAIYPTLMYYQDKLAGAGLIGLTVCGYDRDIQSELADLQQKLSVPVLRLGPATVEDIYKSVLGAVEMVWANLT
jgi:type IV pilus assembly protein PilM